MPQNMESRPYSESDNLASCLAVIYSITSAVIYSVTTAGKLTALKDMLSS